MPKGFGKGPPWFHDKFKDCGCRMTEQRLSILDILSKSSEHPSAEDIYFEVHKIYPDIGLTDSLQNTGIACPDGNSIKI